MDIAGNVARVRERIAKACAISGRDSGDVALLAATKTQAADAVRAAIAAGVDAAGENRVQELVLKNSQSAYTGAPLHFIGRLQSNKVNKLVGTCDIIQSVDSVGLMALIDKRARSMGLSQEILIEVNIGKEGGKSGVFAENLDEILSAAALMTNVSVRGLMTIPPAQDSDGGDSRKYFSLMYKLFVDIRGKKYDNVSMDLLSMGMSGDFEAAIMEGSSLIRPGFAIFGQRTR